MWLRFRTEFLLAVGCLILGFLYVESNRVAPQHHQHYEGEIARLRAIESRLNEGVLRVRAGLLGHYDSLVRSRDERNSAIERVSIPPAYFDARDRVVYQEALAGYKESVRRKTQLEEKFKSADAAVRGSIRYFPMIAEILIEEMEAAPSAAKSVDEIRRDVRAILSYLSIGGVMQHAASVRAIESFFTLEADPPSGVDPNLVAAVATHARNVVQHKPRLDRLTLRVVDDSSAADLEALFVAYRKGHAAAAARAERFQLALYVCSALMLIGVSISLRRLVQARSSLAAGNDRLELRVRERTAELQEAKARLEADGQALHELNQKLEVSYRELDETRRIQLELRDKFLSHVSHELRTPLTAVHQFISLVLDGVGGEIEGEQRDYLEVAFRNVRQMTQMIADLMEVTRAQSGKLRIDLHPVEVSGLVAEVVATLRSKALKSGVTLTSPDDEDLPNALADPIRVRQVLNNLIENAIKFTPDGGAIEVLLTSAESTREICVSVRDTGFGIPPDSIGRVFDELHQGSAGEIRSRKGLGLGLSICKELVERMEGRIWVESVLEKGSTFHFTLPAFGLADLIGEVVRHDDGIVEACTVLSVRVYPRTQGNLSEAVRREVRHKLRSLVYHDRDTVLPRLAWDAKFEQFFVVAPTGEIGAAAMSTRFGKALSAKFAGEELEIELDSRVFDLTPSSGHEDGFEATMKSISDFIGLRKQGVK